MGFWGIEIKPGKKVNPYEGHDTSERLRITQATLGNGSSTEKSILQCYYGEHKGAVNLCSLLPDRIESSLLDLEIEEDDGLDFSVSGQLSIHLSGYFLPEEEAEDRDDADYDSGEDAAHMCCSGSDSSEFDCEDAHNFDSEDSDLDLYSPVKKSGVVIEEITDDQDAIKSNSKPKLLKNKSNKSEKKRELLHEVARSNSSPVLESEDEDGFPTSHSQKSGDNQKNDGHGNAKSKKRDMKAMDLDEESDRQAKKKKKKQKKMLKENDHKEVSDCAEMVVEAEHKPKEVINTVAKPSAVEPSNVNAPSENGAEKKKKKKKKSKESKEGLNGNNQVSTAGDEKTSSLASMAEAKAEAKASQVRSFANGMIVEELQMGKPDGKKAAPGKQVAVHYIGKLKKNGTIFDSNVARAPFKFRLGVGQVIKGWDVGVNGMRVGDKRRLTLPPSMGYGAKGAGGKIPPNAWLMFDVELVDVR